MSDRITFEIGELVLEGFRAADRRRIADSLAAELEVLLARPEVAASFRSVEDAGSARPEVKLGAQARPEEIGRRLADALLQTAGFHGALSSGASPSRTQQPPHAQAGSSRGGPPSAPASKTSAQEPVPAYGGEHG